MNQQGRAVPTLERGWVHDGLDVFAPLRSAFDARNEGLLAAAHTTELLARIASWGAFRRP